ncbi:MAG: hypothetical protein ACYTDT_03460 [Planctomycetota bacterium]
MTTKRTKRSSIVWLAASIVVVFGCVAIVLSFGNPFRVDPNPPHPEPPQPPRPPYLIHGKSLKKMEKIATALRTYRNDQGGGARFPMTLEELSMLQILPHDFDYSGPITGQQMPYDPMIPPTEDPSTWVICLDAQVNSGYNNYGREVKEVEVAAVILGDGTAKILTEQELKGYGGLDRYLGFAR